MKQKARNKMARDTAELTDPKKEQVKPKKELHKIVDDIFKNGTTLEEREDWKDGVERERNSTFAAKEAITRLSKWLDGGEKEDNDLAKVAWFCISQIVREENEAEQAEKDQAEAVKSAEKGINKTGDTQPNEERRQEANKRASV